MVKKILFAFLMCTPALCLYSQENDTIQEMFDRPEVMPTKKDLCSFILSRIKYPQSAIDDTIQGIVLIDFYVEIDGQTSNHRIVKGPRNDLNEEALRVVKLLEFDKPAFSRGIPVITSYLVPIKFSLFYDCSASTLIPIIECEDIYSGSYIAPNPELSKKTAKIRKNRTKGS